jgi:zinc transport system substrate-binding protein
VVVKSDTMHPMYRCVILCVLWCLSSAAVADVRVVATIFPVADMVRQIGRDAVQVTTLLPAGASPHTFEPIPENVRAVAQAAVFVEVGAGLDTWAEKLRAAHTGPMTVVTLTAGLPLLNAAHDHGEPHSGDPRGGDPHGGDPHVWLDPILVRDHCVPAILRALSQADPARQAIFDQGASELAAALTRLDADIRGAFAAVPNRNYVAFHSAWRYFGRRYDLREVAVVESFPGKEPSAREVAAVIEQARAAGVKTVLVEPQFNPRMAEQIAHDIGAHLTVVDPLGGPDLPGRTQYLELMRYNLQAFVKALL